MSIKHSLASKARWAKVPADKRSEQMSKIASIRMKNKTPAERKAIAMGLVRARQEA